MDIPVRSIEQYFTQKDKPSLPFNIEYINEKRELHLSEIHSHDYFQIIIIDEGYANHSIEYESPVVMKPYSVSVVFPKQIHQISFSPDCKGVVFMFEEALFCSDILKKELRSYNTNLYKKLNIINYDKGGYRDIRDMIDSIITLFNDISPIKKEQIRFYIKILLLQMIEYVHEKELPAKSLPVVNIYSRYKEFIDTYYSQSKTVSEYASLLGISPKKLNEVCKTEAGMTALAVIHERIMVEIKRMLMFSGESMKEIAFSVGFASPSALNKFIYSKTGKTPTELKNSMSQNDKRKD